MVQDYYIVKKDMCSAVSVVFKRVEAHGSLCGLLLCCHFDKNSLQLEIPLIGTESSFTRMFQLVLSVLRAQTSGAWSLDDNYIITVTRSSLSVRIFGAAELKLRFDLTPILRAQCVRDLHEIFTTQKAI